MGKTVEVGSAFLRIARILASIGSALAVCYLLLRVRGLSSGGMPQALAPRTPQWAITPHPSELRLWRFMIPTSACAHGLDGRHHAI